MDISTILGLLTGFGAILIGFMLEGGTLGSLILPSPAIIVFGGTIGAVLLSFSLKDIMGVPKIIMSLLTTKKSKTPQLIEQLVEMSDIARREGLLGLEKIVNSDGKTDPFLKKSVMLLIDGTDMQRMRETLDNEIYIEEQKKKIEISIFEAAGGFSPTLGIIGTVMGLINVLGNMSTPEALAESISVAFVATLYGVCFANVLYLPLANKLKLKLKRFKIERELIIEGVMAIRNGESQKAVREKLDIYLQFESIKTKGGGKGK